MQDQSQNSFPVQESAISHGTQVELEPGMLGAAGMREPRAGVRIIGRRLHVGFGASCCPPAGSISLRIAHLHAAASQVRFRTMAVAAACGNSSQQCGRVCQDGEGAAQDDDSQEVESAEGTPPQDGFAEEPTHRHILGRAWKKTDSPESSKISLPWSWNQVARVRSNALEREAFPDSDRGQCRIEPIVQIWRK